jgi:hypothetical protein
MNPAAIKSAAVLGPCLLFERKNFTTLQYFRLFIVIIVQPKTN